MQSNAVGRELRIEHITFDELKGYWIEVDHFQDPLKRYSSHVGELGHFRCHDKDPRRICYGLFDGDRLVGGTQLVAWAPDTVRYRTLNIREAYRGSGLGYALLKTALGRDWRDFGRIFGWVRRSHYGWAIRHGFSEIDGVWVHDHIGMGRAVVWDEGRG